MREKKISQLFVELFNEKYVQIALEIFVADFKTLLSGDIALES